MASKTLKSFDLQKIAEMTHCKLVGNPGHVIIEVADLKSATFQEASFLANPRYQHQLLHSSAGAIFIDAKTELVDGKIISSPMIPPKPSKSLLTLCILLAAILPALPASTALRLSMKQPQ